MATELCRKCRQAHPGRVCDHDEEGECAETIGTDEVAETGKRLARAIDRAGGTVKPLPDGGVAPSTDIHQT